MRTTGFKAIVKAAIPSRVAVFSGGRKGASVALTFDDGPAPGITEEVVRILAGRGHRATFFIIGQRAEANPGIVDCIVRSGCEIGNHTYSHAAVTSLSYRKIQEEIERTERAVSAVIRHPLPFRPPKGLVSLPLLAYLWRQKPRGAPILWSVCVPRGHRKSVEEIVADLEAANIVAGDIILLHDDNAKIVDALPRILDCIERRGLRSVPVGELCA